MKIQNMESNKGNKVANQFIIFDSEATYFQSYQSIIIKATFEDGQRKVYLDSNTWDYSKTTAKYRNIFLGETSKDVQRKVKDGTYILTDLNA